MNERTIETISLDGGWLCLDFTNTLSMRTPQPTGEYLHTFEDFLKWARRLQLLSDDEFQAAAQVDDRMQAAVFSKAVKLRETLYQLFEACTESNAPDADTLQAFNQFLSEAYQHRELQTQHGAFEYAFESETWGNPEKPLWQITLSAEELLLSDKLHRVRSCDAHDCGWLFLDTSKNGSRRWCNMQTCGSQVKAKNYYHRIKKHRSEKL